jgi:catechol 2,3-dioxygenase-like lactoylglutathione lyase family enzyme
MLIDHAVIPVSDLESARAFYDKVLEPFKVQVVAEWPGAVVYGAEGGGFVSLRADGAYKGPTHVAFGTDRAGVDRFHELALEAGASDNGAPGVREHYHQNYYGSFVHDADGNNIEAVCHAPA